MYTIHAPAHKLHNPNGLTINGLPFVSRDVPERAEAILAAINSASIGHVLFPRDSGLEPVLAVHDAAYVAYLRGAYEIHAGFFGERRPVLVERSGVTPDRPGRPPLDIPGLRDYYTYDYEDPILEGTWTAAYWSAQVALDAAHRVRDGERAAYALCRPPGHHATVDQYGGFCYLNNAAVAARELSRDAPVVVLDLDYHHGNGTQAIFYTDPSVFYVSLHADPIVDYPHFWGYRDEVGEGLGRGANYNIPLPLGTTDVGYLAALDEALDVVADFAPGCVVISLGMDTVGGDPIGKFAVTPQGWAEAGRRVAGLNVPVVIVQEGGYRVETIGELAVTFLSAFADDSCRCQFTR